LIVAGVLTLGFLAFCVAAIGAVMWLVSRLLRARETKRSTATSTDNEVPS